MKRIFLLSILSLLYFNPAFSVNYAWNGTFSSNWNVNANWTPSTGFPGTGDVVTINNAAVTNICTLDANRTIATLNVSAGTINLGGFILTTSAAMNFTGGVVQNGFISTDNITDISNTTFNGTIGITKNAGNNDNLTGGNTFNGNTTITNNDNSNLRMANTNGDNFTGAATFVNTSSGDFSIARSGTNIFASTITINNSGSGGISFGSNGGVSTQSTGGLSTSGFTGGTLTINNFTQTAATANGAFNPTEFSATSSIFRGDFSVVTSSGDITINACTFSASNVFTATGRISVLNANNFSTLSGVSAFTRNGGNGNVNWTGGNTFGNVMVTNNDNDNLRMSNTNGDDFNGTATFVQASSGTLSPAFNGNNTFSGNISTTGTTTAIIFGSGTGIAIIDGNSTQTFSGASAQTPIVNRLTMNTSGTGNLTLAVPVNVSVDLTLTNGIINTSATNILTLTDESVTVTNITTSATSYVDGPMNYTTNTNTANSTLFFPVGDNGYAAPIQLTYSHSNTTSVTYTTQNFYGNANGLGFVLPASIAYVSRIRYYKMDRSAVANLSNARVRIYYAAIDGVTNPMTLKVAKSTNNSSPWIDIGGSATGTPTGSILSNTFTSFSYFALATDPFAINPLPIELLSFTAIPNGDKVDLKWITATELDNDFFTIERSKDAVNFEFVSEIDGAGTSINVLNYSSIDPKPLSELSYYRLKQTDFNGKFEYSKIIPVKFDNIVKFEFTIYPNPNDGLLINLRLESEVNEEVVVSVYDMEGKEFYSNFLLIDTNDRNTHQIDFLNKLSTGVYIMTIKNNQGVFKKKMIVE